MLLSLSSLLQTSDVWISCDRGKKKRPIIIITQKRNMSSQQCFCRVCPSRVSSRVLQPVRRAATGINVQGWLSPRWAEHSRLTANQLHLASVAAASYPAQAKGSSLTPTNDKILVTPMSLAVILSRPWLGPLDGLGGYSRGDRLKLPSSFLTGTGPHLRPSCGCCVGCVGW